MAFVSFVVFAIGIVVALGGIGVWIHAWYKLRCIGLGNTSYSDLIVSDEPREAERINQTMSSATPLILRAAIGFFVGIVGVAIAITATYIAPSGVPWSQN